MRPFAAIVPVLLAACVHELQERRPGDERDRERAEAAACWKGTLPPWLDDSALEEGLRLDRWSAAGADADESFRSGTRAAAPALPARRAADTSGSSRYTAIMRERQEFRMRCSLLRSGGRGMLPPGKF